MRKRGVQDLLGGRFSEMSASMNYTYHSFGMRAESKIQPYYDLIATSLLRSSDTGSWCPTP